MPTYNRLKEIWKYSYLIHKDIEKKHQMLKSSLDSKAMRNVVLPPFSPFIWSFLQNIFILY